MCTNPMVSLPDANRVEAALKDARFVVVQDISDQNQALPFADLVLPAAGHFEKEGTMTNSERRVTYLGKVTDPPGEALPDAEILLRFGRAMGFSGFHHASMADVFRSDEQTSELQPLMRISYAVFSLNKKTIRSTSNYQSN